MNTAIRAIADIKADMQDALYAAMDRGDTSEEALAALLPIVDRYVVAAVRRQADAYREALHSADDATQIALLHVRADTLDKFTDGYAAGARCP